MMKTLNSKVIDELSMAIIRELCENARTSTAEIGRRVGLTAPAVAERISKLEEAGYITGYHATIDYDKLGMTIQAFISFKCTDKNHDIKATITGIPEIMEWYTITGQASLLLKVVTASRERLAKIIIQLEEFGETNTSLVLEGNAEVNVFKKEA
ncbi:MAG TPA: Lrp/AsnC family transcriptional regulator [Chitinophagaceae bacterium]|jgi:Lrp/AsnC family leucine-responsive transcriptional regulator|nr:Lrp/AsnC family transcriptional regulator [Chitinophagaceae bacterium]